MRKTLLFLAAVGFLYFCGVVLVNWYNDIDADVNHKAQVNDARLAEASGETPGSIASRSVHGSTGTSASPSSTPAPAAQEKSFLVIPRVGVTQTLHSNIVICLKDIDAFSPTNANQLIGRFNKDTKLVVGSKDPVSGKYFVVFEPKGGRPITALCKAEDLGR